MAKAFLLLVAVFCSFSGAAVADATVSNGTVLEGTVGSTISTATAQVGDRVVIEGAHDNSGAITGTLYGHVTQVQAAGRGRRAQLAFVLDRLSTDSATFSVDAVSEGIIPPGSSVGKQNTATIIGALAGAMLGRAVGHSSAAMIAGAAAGAGAGFLLTSNNYQNLSLQQGSTVKVLLRSVTRMQSTGP